MRLLKVAVGLAAATVGLCLLLSSCQDMKWSWKTGADLDQLEAGAQLTSPVGLRGKPDAAVPGPESAAGTESLEPESLEPESGVESVPTESVEAESVAFEEGAESAVAGLTEVESVPAPESGPVVEPEATQAPEVSATVEPTPRAVPPKPAPEPLAPAARAEEAAAAPRDRVPLAAPTAERPRGESAVTLTAIVDAMAEQAIVDCKVVRGHVEAAQRAITAGEATQARQAVLAAIRASAFVRAGLPSLMIRECLERGIVQTEGGRFDKAREAIEAAAGLVTDVPLRGTVAEFRRRAAEAVDALDRNDPAKARDVMRQMNGIVMPGEAETVASRLADNLVGALSALDRDALSVATAELNEASSRAFDLTRLLGGAG